MFVLAENNTVGVAQCGTGLSEPDDTGVIGGAWSLTTKGWTWIVL